MNEIATMDVHDDDDDRNKNEETVVVESSNHNENPNSSNNNNDNHSTTTNNTKFHFSIDRGGTFTDIYCRLPYKQGRNENEIVRKLLSEDPNQLYKDAPTEGIRRILEQYGNNELYNYAACAPTTIASTTTTSTKTTSTSTTTTNIPKKICTKEIGTIRMGTTVATNALLERQGSRTALITTYGFHDICKIGNQNRPNIFDLTCQRPVSLYECSIAIDERVVLSQFVQEQDDAGSTTKKKYISKQRGSTGEMIYIEKEPDPIVVRNQLIELRDQGITSLAICLLHGYIYPNHEQLIGQIATSLNCFTYIAMSHTISPMIKLVSRCHTTIAAAYLTPVLQTYIHNFMNGFDNDLLTNVNVQFMKSDGGLSTSIDTDFRGHQAILSGPAGGVVGYAKTTPTIIVDHHKNDDNDNENTNSKEVTTGSTTNRSKITGIIGFDMGGTSTDVSRYDVSNSSSTDDDSSNNTAGGMMEHVMETIIDGITIQAPQLDIHTVAAGGGSILYYMKQGMYKVGPESVGANPGPVCYGRQKYNLQKKQEQQQEQGQEEQLIDNNTNSNGNTSPLLSLAITDANIVLGRIVPQYFPSIFGPNENEPLDVHGTREAFYNTLQHHNHHLTKSIEEVAYGFIQVANETMCRPIRNITQMKGYDLSSHILNCFGGAGPQHACAIAKSLGMKHVYIHQYGGILSAYGLSMADAVHEEQVPANEIYNLNSSSNDHDNGYGYERFEQLTQRAKDVLIQQGYNANDILIERYLNMRYDGTDNAMMILEHPTIPYHEVFRSNYIREFGFDLSSSTTTDIDTNDTSSSSSNSAPPGRAIMIDDYRVRAIVKGYTPSLDSNSNNNINNDNDITTVPVQSVAPPTPDSMTRTYFESGWHTVPVYKMEGLHYGHVLVGPCLIIQPISTVVIEEHCTATVTVRGDLMITIMSARTENEGTTTTDNTTTSTISADKSLSITDNSNNNNINNMDGCDPVQLSIFANRFMGIAEQMGKTLQRTAISVNMKERLDFSCALFTKDGGLVANAPHIPVHLGAMERAVQFQIEYWNSNSSNSEGIQVGDVLVSNHPQLAGGSHLPDITVITPVFHTLTNEIIFFVASRGHHADIGGIAPGSMPPHSTTLHEEGAMIVAYKLVRQGIFQQDGITDLLLHSPKQYSPNNSGTRNLRDNISDLHAQVAANNAGIRLLTELVNEYSLQHVQTYMKYIQQNAEQSVRTMLKEFVHKHNNGNTIAHAIDYMDDGSPIELTITIDPMNGSAIFDFTGTGPQVLSNHNAPPAVTYSAVIYSLRSLVGEEIPLNQGCLKPITFIIPKYTLLNPSNTAAVVGGNVVTSQRVVDVVLRAFRACAASQGCMNNLTFGNTTFGYYETIAGGAGAGPYWHGESGVHTHCTNTRITDPEILERRYPVLLRQFSIRPNSGGIGLFNGGNGCIRELEPLQPLIMSILSERRTLHPYGMAGGMDGACGRNLIIRKLQQNDNNDDEIDGTSSIVINIGGRCTTTLNVGDRLRIETPGGGGYGKPLPTPPPTTTLM